MSGTPRVTMTGLCCRLWQNKQQTSGRRDNRHWPSVSCLPVVPGVWTGGGQRQRWLEASSSGTLQVHGSSRSPTTGCPVRSLRIFVTGSRHRRTFAGLLCGVPGEEARLPHVVGAWARRHENSWRLVVAAVIVSGFVQWRFSFLDVFVIGLSLWRCFQILILYMLFCLNGFISQIWEIDKFLDEI